MRYCAADAFFSYNWGRPTADRGYLHSHAVFETLEGDTEAESSPIALEMLRLHQVETLTSLPARSRDKIDGRSIILFKAAFTGGWKDA